jgi:hypothetical protein
MLNSFKMLSEATIIFLVYLPKMKAQLFQASFKGGALDGMSFSVEVGQIALYSIEVKDCREIKHMYQFEGGRFIYKGIVSQLN